MPGESSFFFRVFLFGAFKMLLDLRGKSPSRDNKDLCAVLAALAQVKILLKLYSSTVPRRFGNAPGVGSFCRFGEFIFVNSQVNSHGNKSSHPEVEMMFLDTFFFMTKKFVSSISAEMEN